jgi:AraC-like DNA-binding protein
MDVLSDALRVIRLRGAFFLNAEFGEPWCVVAPAGVDLARRHAGAGDRVAVSHLIVEGGCWITAQGGEMISLEPGDVVVLPHGDAHHIGSGRNRAPMGQSHAVHLELPALRRARYGGDGAATSVICGWFSYEGHLANAVMAAWPRVVRTNVRRRPAGQWLESAARHAVAEAAAERPGSEALANKVAELLFFEALRGYLESMPPQQAGWLAGLRDPLVARSLALMHTRPSHPWTIASMAREVNSSRTVLAERFGSTVGIPPMQYLTRWRVVLAAHLLRGGEANLGRIAESVGYESEAAFSRAFKREFGVPPGAWRRTGLAS